MDNKQIHIKSMTIKQIQLTLIQKNEIQYSKVKLHHSLQKVNVWKYIHKSHRVELTTQPRTSTTFKIAFLETNQ